MADESDDIPLVGEEAPLIDADPELLQAFLQQQRHRKKPTEARDATSDISITQTKSPKSTTTNPPNGAESVPRASSPRKPSDASPVVPTRTTYGLQTAAQLHKEKVSQAQHRKQLMESLDTSVSGRDAATVYRTKTGKVSDMAAQRAEEAARRRREEERLMEQMEWGKGLVQKQDRELKTKRLEDEKSQPLARYANDQELNRELSQRTRWDDPATKFIKNKSTSKPQYPVYQGPTPPPNRFGIQPGFRWDGVDRSNGFESNYFSTQNSRIASAQRDYVYRTEDL
ncbi:Pre-mRNA-splicing factor cwc26 [Dispira parvispora]|uniref:Pre-mRNA-splicing factor cwc26 n=1 Tax=Dispira parvispora TaxID=1520584 RepID=A0A9W8E834_9FUNG|nr:Pre-mRNA-splicing factor cwc26 [Dispira parvispora]